MKNILLTILVTLALAKIQASEINTEINEIENLNKVREKYFEQGFEFDSTAVEKAKNSNIPEIKRYAEGLQALYQLQTFKPLSDSVWITITDTTWFQNPKYRDFELILVDDVFRNLLVTKRYFLAHLLITRLFNSEFERFYLVYSNILYLKTCNYVMFFQTQNLVGEKFIIELDVIKSKYLKKVLDRYKLNIIAINIVNYNLVDKNGFSNSLMNQITLDQKSSLEDLIYSCNVATYLPVDTNTLKKLNLQLYKHLLSKKYVPAYITEIVFKNLPLYKEMREYLFQSSINGKYGKHLRYFMELDLFLFEKKDFNKNSYDKNLFMGVFLDNKYEKISILKKVELDHIYQTLYEIDTIRSKYYLPEPNWLRLQVIQLTYNFNNIGIFSKYRDSTFYIDEFEKSAIKNFNKTKEIIEQYDLTGLIAPISGLLDFYEISDYFFGTPDSLIKNDTSKNELLLNYVSLFKYLINSDYFYINYFSVEKSEMLSQLGAIKTYIEQILLAKSRIPEYNYITKFFDSPKALIDFDPILLNANSRERYYSFKQIASPEELNKFDSLLIKYLFKIPGKVKSQVNNYEAFFDFTKPIIKDILIDIKKRKSSPDLILVNLLTSNDILAKSIFEYSLDGNNFFEDTISNSILRYKNQTFCIDNSTLNLNSNDTSIINGIDLINYNKSDIKSNYVWYFISERFEKNHILTKSPKDFLYKRIYDLYVCFSNMNNNKIIKLCSLDSLKLVLDYRYPNSESFIPKNYFDQIDEIYLQLYKIFFEPIEKYLNNTEDVKLVIPNELIAIPLDYIYAKKNLKLLKFKEYSSLYRAVSKSGDNTINKTDSITVFSELIYNNVYCNLNKSVQSRTRGGILELQYSKSESQNIEKYFNVRKFTKLDANKSNFLNALNNKTFKNIHLITHGAYIPDYTNSNLVTDNESLLSASKNNDNPNERQLLLFSSDSLVDVSRNNIITAHEIRYMWDLSHINLIFLSACETGMIEDPYPTTSGYRGFVNNFLERGAKNVIVSRWKIDDKYAMEFSSKYYEYLSVTKSYNEAFQKTKNYFYKLGAPAHLWSSYVLIQ